jgi:hypothetical protein
MNNGITVVTEIQKEVFDHIVITQINIMIVGTYSFESCGLEIIYLSPIYETIVSCNIQNKALMPECFKIANNVVADESGPTCHNKFHTAISALIAL